MTTAEITEELESALYLRFYASLELKKIFVDSWRNTESYFTIIPQSLRTQGDFGKSFSCSRSWCKPDLDIET